MAAYNSLVDCSGKSLKGYDLRTAGVNLVKCRVAGQLEICSGHPTALPEWHRTAHRFALRWPFFGVWRTAVLRADLDLLRSCRREAELTFEGAVKRRL